MRKLLAGFLAASLTLSLVACSSGDGGSTNDGGNSNVSGNDGGNTGGDTGNSGNSGGDSGSSGGNTGSDATSLAGTYEITVWASENATDLTIKQIEDFNSSNTDGIVIKATVEPMSESEAATNMITDVEAGPDIYCFAQDQFALLVQAGALAKLGVSATATVTDANDPSVVSAGKVGSDLYAYPLTSDNGYFMYYDKSVIPEADVDDLAKIIADCEGASKYFAMSLEDSAWYLASFFFATDCISEWVTDDDGAFVSVNDTFDSANGLIAAKGVKPLLDSPMHLDTDKASEFANGAAVVVSGTWDYTTALDILGDNLGVTDLPSFTVDGTSYHMGSYSGCKLMGVKPQVDAVRLAVLHRLAQFLTDEQRQLERFENLAWGPANLNAQQSEEVQSNPGLAALFKQNAYAVPQAQIHGSWWDIAKVIATDIRAASSDEEMQAALSSYHAKLEALFNMSSDELNAFTVIGDINGDGWSIDLPMIEMDGVWTTVQAYDLVEGNKFKVRQGKSWDVAYPAEDFVVETAGTFKIQLDPASGEVTLVAE